jgi:hypothetical protein
MILNLKPEKIDIPKKNKNEKKTKKIKQSLHMFMKSVIKYIVEYSVIPTEMSNVM